MNVEQKPYTVKQLVRAFVAGSLLRNDEYQRGEVWSTLQKATFVDSIFRQYPVPAFFLHRVESPGLDDGPVTKYEVIDGQQRLTALRDYCANSFSLFRMDGEPKLRLPRGVRGLAAPWAGKSFNELSKDLRESFENSLLTVFVVAQGGHPDEIRDLFIRLQSGTALTRQQVRDAWPGNVGPFVERLAGKLKIRPSAKLFGVIDKRGLRADDELRDTYVFDRQMCAQLLKVFLARAADGYSYPSVSANALDALYHEYTDLEPDGDAAERFRQNLDACAQVFESVKRKDPNKKKFRRIEVTAVMMYLQDAARDPQFKFGRETSAAIAENIARHGRDGAPVDPPKGKGTSPSHLKTYYDWWLREVARGAGVRLDPRRAFDAADKQEIFKRDKGACGVCGEVVDDDVAEYDHWPVPHHSGGRTVSANGRLVHRECHPRGRPVYDD